MTEDDFLCEEPPAYGGAGKPSPLEEYLRKLERALRRGDATEHTHRPALKELGPQGDAKKETEAAAEFAETPKLLKLKHSSQRN
jgi:hypothetical protein